MSSGNRSDSPFTKEEEQFIVESFVKLKSPIAVKRSFFKQFKTTRKQKWLQKLKPFQFTRVYRRFTGNGIAKTSNAGQKRGVEGQKTKPEKIKVIEDYFISHPMNSLHQASVFLKIPKPTISRILRTKTSLFPYKISTAQVLTTAHKAQRLEFCQWLIEKSDEFISHLIVENEKWFQLSQHPNRQNVRYWGVSKPDFVFDTKNQSVKKIMAFVIVVEGQSFLFWHEDPESGKPISVATDQYIKSVKELLANFPQAKLDVYWWQQDGAPCHTSNKTIAYLKSVFGDRIISRLAKIVGVPAWPAHSPDLNPLDYSFWGQAMQKVWEVQPTTIEGLKEVVQDFFASMEPDLVKRSVLNIKKRAKLCIKAKGGHFEHQM